MEDTLEFWDDLDPLPGSLHGIKLNHRKSPFKYREDLLPNAEEIAYLKNSLNSLYASHKQKIKSLQVSERKATIETVQQALNSLQAKLQYQVSQAKEENEKMVSQIKIQSSDITIVSQYLIDFELFLSQNRIQAPKAPLLTNPQKFEVQESQLKKELALVKMTIQGMKEGIRSYKLQTESTDNKITALKESLVTLRANYEQEIRDFEAFCVEKLRKEKEENVKLKKESDEMRVCKLNELDYIEKKCNSNEEIIESLQFELKSIKEILNYPVLKLRVHNKLQDYLGDHNLNFKPVSAPRKPQTTKRIKVMNLSQDLDFNLKSSVEEFSPFVSKLNLSSRKTSSTGTRAKLHKLVQFFNTYDLPNP